MKFFLSTSFLLLCNSLSAQVGGEYQTYYEHLGSSDNDGYRLCVSGAGDINQDGFADYIIGRPGENAGGLLSAGTASVYSGHTGLQLYYLEGLEYTANFGLSVSGAGDVDADGFDDFIIGEPHADHNNLHRVGSVYVYSGATGALLHMFEGSNEYDSFGSAVSGAGDVNGDGYADLIVGCESATTNGMASIGYARVFSGATGAQLIQIDGGSAGARFGACVSELGDINQDGFDDFIISAPGADPAGLNAAGKVIVYSGATGHVLHTFSGANAAESMGMSASNAGDVDQDGTPDIVMGAPWAKPNGNAYAGTVYVYSGSTGSLIHTFHGPYANAALGKSVDGAGDVNGDGYADLILGAHWASPNGPFSGRAYIASGTSGDVLHQYDGGVEEDFLGESVAGVGDTNGNGLAEVIIGAPGADIWPTDWSVGAAYVVGLDPFLISNTKTLSASLGGTVQFDLDFPNSTAGDDYKILFSASGVGPVNYGVDIPLTVDSLVHDSFQGNYPFPNSIALHGTLDAAGAATGLAIFPSALPSSLIGHTYWAAAIANQPGLLPEFSSVAVAIEIIP